MKGKQMAPLIWIREFLFKHITNYGHAIRIPDTGPDWERFISRYRGGNTGIERDPKDEYRWVDEFTISDELRNWSVEHQVKMKHRFILEHGDSTWVRPARLALVVRFLSKADASQFKLTFL